MLKRLSLILVLLAAWPAQGQDLPDVAAWSHDNRPAFMAPNLQDLDDNPLSLAFNGVTIVHFWAGWCPPCVVELPALNQLAGALVGPKVQIIAVSEDKTRSDLARFLDHHPPLPDLRIAFDGQRALARAMTVKMLPVTIILGPDGRERARLTGDGDWNGADRQKLQEEIAAALR